MDDQDKLAWVAD